MRHIFVCVAFHVICSIFCLFTSVCYIRFTSIWSKYANSNVVQYCSSIVNQSLTNANSFWYDWWRGVFTIFYTEKFISCNAFHPYNWMRACETREFQVNLNILNRIDLHIHFAFMRSFNKIKLLQIEIIGAKTTQMLYPHDWTSSDIFVRFMFLVSITKTRTHKHLAVSFSQFFSNEIES